MSQLLQKAREARGQSWIFEEDPEDATNHPQESTMEDNGSNSENMS
jgi:hypothetical protein